MSNSLEKAISIVVKVAEPEKIILFGSRAKGEHTSESDYDLLVLKKGVRQPRKLAQKIYLSFKDGKLTMVATDGRRLALVEHEIDFPSEAEADLILPSKAVNELQHTLNDEGENYG